MLINILPIGFECGVLNGKVEPGSTVAIVGSRSNRACRVADRVVLFALKVIMIDLDENRLAVAKRFDATSTMNADSGSPVDAVMRLTGAFLSFR